MTVVPGIVILTALRHEARAIAKALKLRFVSQMRATSENEDEIHLHVVGPRCMRLPAKAEVNGKRGIILAGLGGALDPGLRVGDVVVDETSDLPTPPGQWRRGRIHCAANVVATAEDKLALFRSTGDLAVDLETAAARRFAAAAGLPYLGIRAISDAAGDPLDPVFMTWIADSGEVRPGKVALDLCRRPRLIPQVWRLRSQSSLALGRLTEALRQIVNHDRITRSGRPASAPL